MKSRSAHNFAKKKPKYITDLHLTTFERNWFLSWKLQGKVMGEKKAQIGTGSKTPLHTRPALWTKLFYIVRRLFCHVFTQFWIIVKVELHHYLAHVGDENDRKNCVVCYESLGKRVKTSYKCNSCGVGLCNAKKDRNCFVLYHSQDHN